MLKRIEREPLWDRAQTQLRDALLAGQFGSGSVLTLRSLAETFGTSITPVRDAVNRLVAQGVLENGPRNAAMVPNVTVALLRELTLVRTELEGRAAREAARNVTPETVDTLERQLNSMRRLIADHELRAYLHAHRTFHFTVYATAGVPLLYEMIENLWLRCGPVLTYVIPDYVLSLKGSDRHAAVLEAMRTNDPDSAEAAIVLDIQEAADYLSSRADYDGRILASPH